MRLFGAATLACSLALACLAGAGEIAHAQPAPSPLPSPPQTGARGSEGGDAGASTSTPSDGGAPAPSLNEAATTAAEATAATPTPAPAATVEASASTPAADATAEASAALAPERGFWERTGLLGEISSKGEVGVESRLFRNDDNAATEDQALGLLGRLELRHTHGGGVFDEKLRAYGRMDKFDERRSVLVLEEGWIQASSERLRLRLGFDVVNWTATEAFHPADVINARNLDSDLENYEKIGEPMVALSARVLDDTTLTAIYMPYRTAPNFGSPRSRLGFTSGQDVRDARKMLNRNGRLTTNEFGGPQAAVALRQVLGSADITLHALEHMDRSQPLVRVDPATFSPYLLYQTVRQVGGTYQHALGSLLVKLEGAYRHFVAPTVPLPGFAVTGTDEGQPNHTQLALGLEYGIPHESGGESTLLLEGQALLGVEGEKERSNLSVFQRDVLVGYRLALNDESGKELLLGAILDLERAGESLLTLNYLQRLGETWTIRFGLRIFNAKSDAPGPLALLRSADHVRLTLTRHF